MDDELDIPTPVDAMTDALVGAGFVIGRIRNHICQSQARTGRTRPTVPEASGSAAIEPMGAHRGFGLGAARVPEDALVQVAEEVHPLPIEEYAAC